MSGTRFQYDESGSTFFYFLLSFEALVVIPCTYYFYPRSSTRTEKREKTLCNCDHCRIKACRLRLKEPWRKAKERLIKLLLFIGWVALALTAYKVTHLQHDYVAYDPFEILEIEADASVAEIKKAYRRLSLIHHPDMETGDEKKFMMIAKAYAALTDEEARKNWQVYGNPDGPQAMSFGIALPSWIVEKNNSVFVLGLYALVFMVALPVTVGIWWHRSVQYGGEQVLLATTQLYLSFIYKTPHMIFKRVIMILAASVEFRRQYNSEIIERPSDNVEVPLLIKELPNLGEKNKERPLCFSYSIKARALLHAHLHRMKLPSSNLEEDQMYIVKKCPTLISEFVQCASQMTMLALAGRISRIPNLDTIENAMKLSACIVQALWDNKSPLLQLPHINEDMLRHFCTRKRNIRSIRQLACMKEDDRKNMLRNLTADEYSNIMNVIGRMPIIDVNVKIEVEDDEDNSTITAGAFVTVTANLMRSNMSTLFDTLNDESAEFVEEKDEAPGVTEEVQKPKSKTSDKYKKKKGKGSSKLKKKTFTSKAAAAVKKSEHENHLKNGILHRSKVDEEKASDDSAAESNDDESGSNSGHSGSEDRDHDSRKDNKHEKEEDEEWEKFQAKVSKRDKILEGKSRKSHPVHCPFFPDEKEEFWFVYLCDRKRHSLITAPYLVTNLVSKEEVELKFTAPEKPGIYTYSLMVRSDSYLDCDVVKTIKLDVKEAKEVDLSKLQWDVSEEEEEKDEEESAVEDSDLATDDEIDDD
ncbi:translocation protein SEC63 homolog [Argiope bruennichi]|uniref:Translocation protein SEC63 like protein n=1 Tax=Argiope bruennichi TaxID=94029 RepID=A0A8T0EKQ4_ARGBR|nr:translocation protein SEC63 homolog [Argiope bruennichi]KAF8771928.1 Translocation protein SEC63 like protein [Argiope bruennichi]